jgi:hypothetical protein
MNEEIPSIISDHDLCTGFEERIKQLLEKQSGPANRFIHHVVPKLHVLGPIFKVTSFLDSSMQKMLAVAEKIRVRRIHHRLLEALIVAHPYRVRIAVVVSS